MQKLKILTVFGTRPEVIKLAPFIKVVSADPDCICITCATTQHRELQNDMLKLFGINPDYDLDIMIEGQDLFHITGLVLTKIKEVLDREKPDCLVVQGDTTTAFVAALAGFYKKIPVIHVEAGLRTGKLYSPFPEEVNRCLISRLVTLHMAPTRKAVTNLAKEGFLDNVFMVGNPIVDSVSWTLENFEPDNVLIKEKINSSERKILITVHRRENFGEPLKNICVAIKKLCHLYPQHTFIWPLHPNPEVKSSISHILNGIGNLHLVEPLSYSDLLLLINSCSLILSDSGGIQEEACIMGKKIIILREDTERIEVVEAGVGVLVGSDERKILTNFNRLMDAAHAELQESVHNNMYGDPGVSTRILLKIKENIIKCG